MADTDEALGVVEAVLAAPELPAPPNKRGKRGNDSDAVNETSVALESAVSTLETQGRQRGFDSATLEKLLELAVWCAHSATPSRLQLLRRILRFAAPNSEQVSIANVIRLGSALTSVAPRSRQPLLEWLLAAWPSLPAGALRPLYFSLFQQLQHATLLEPAACLLCKISIPSDVMPFRLRRLTRLFEKTGEPWAAALVCLYQKLEPDCVVLPFDARRAVGSDSKLAKMLDQAAIAGKAHAQWRTDFATARGAVPVPTELQTNKPPDTQQPNEKISVLPMPSFLYDAHSGMRLDTATTLAAVAQLIAGNKIPRLPDHLISAFSSRTTAQFVNVALTEEPAQLDRIEHWISHALRLHCRGTSWSADGKATIETICHIASVLRELPPAAEAELSRLLAPGSPYLHAASRMLQWLRPESLLGKEALYLGHLLGPVLAGIGAPEDISSVLSGLSLLCIRITAIEDIPSLFNSQQSPPTQTQIIGCLQAIAEYLWEEAASADPSADTAGLFLATAETLVGCGVAVSFPHVLLSGMFHSSQPDIVSRALGIAVDFSAVYKIAGQVNDEWKSKLLQFVGLVSTELLETTSDHSLLTHPALVSLADKFVGIVKQKAPSPESITPEVAMAHRGDLIEFLAARGLSGLQKFHQKWPL